MSKQFDMLASQSQKLQQDLAQTQDMLDDGFATCHPGDRVPCTWEGECYTQLLLVAASGQWLQQPYVFRHHSSQQRKLSHRPSGSFDKLCGREIA